LSVRKLLIIGDGEFAEIAYEYFTNDSEHEVVAFAVEGAYLKKDSLYDLPVVALEDVEQRYSPEEHRVFVAVTYTQLNRVRTRLLRTVREKGYTAVSYVSSRAFVWHNVQIGANCFVFEGNVIQHQARIGDNVILWSGNHVGHRAVIGDNSFFSSHVVLSGYAQVGESCFAGVNSTVGDYVKIGRDVVIGAGSVVLKNVPDRQVMRGNPAVAATIDSRRMFRLRSDE
jgi:sugar O-acyltransferase (sialic acid O-acetyltransferase NeuD family)